MLTLCRVPHTQACAGYTYFALQNGGWCNCDNSYSTPASTYPNKPLSDCNKGGTGYGGAWRNAIYTANTGGCPTDGGEKCVSCATGYSLEVRSTPGHTGTHLPPATHTLTMCGLPGRHLRAARGSPPPHNLLFQGLHLCLLGPLDAMVARASPPLCFKSPGIRLSLRVAGWEERQVLQGLWSNHPQGEALRGLAVQGMCVATA